MSNIPAIVGSTRTARSTANSGTPESKVVAAVRDWAKQRPDVYICRVIQAGASGTPDFLLCIKGRFVGVECKATGAKPRPLQYKHGNDIVAAGGVFIWGDADVLIPALNKLYKE